MPGIIRARLTAGRMEHDLAAPDTILVSELPAIERVVAFVASRHHLRSAEAADFASHVTMKLVENDYAILRKFEGRSSLRTYLTVVIQRLFLDYSVAKWGKWRPSAPAKRAGDIGIRLERLLMRDGYSFDEACEILLTNHQIRISRRKLERIAAMLPVRRKRRFETDASLVDHAADLPGADILVERNDRSVYARRVSAVLKHLLAAKGPQDRLILVLHFVDGCNRAEIASTLGIDQKRFYRHFDHLLSDLRAGLEAEGIGADEALAIFDDPEIFVDW